MACRWLALTSSTAGLLASCASAEPAGIAGAAALDAGSGPAPLTVAESWSLADPAEDPFAPEAVGRVSCTSAAYRTEGTWLEVTTTTCNYASFVSVFPSEVPAGSKIRGELAWATLAALAPAVGTLAFATQADLLWSHEVPIPGLADLVQVEFEVPERLATGSALYFHVRNHGYNSWQLGPLTLERPPAGN
ncbi:MAG TPA: hypothetical protein VJU61_16630 [Polyangiaceae bacterium]|nr:hypothetical protein [Polyangiaceae bacterium]